MTTAPSDPVARLLYEARIAKAGAGITLDASDFAAMAELNQKSRNLIRDAERNDPKHLSPAWHSELEGALREESDRV